MMWLHHVTRGSAIAKGLRDALSVEILQLWYKTSHLRTRAPGLSCGIICVILRLAVFTQYRSVTDTLTQMDGQIHDDDTYQA